MPAFTESMREAGGPDSGEMLDTAIETVYNKLKHVNHSEHIVSLSQELRELIRMKKDMGDEK